jgi:hypothetical protein
MLTGVWNGITLATSKDGVHFAEVGPILKKKEDACWLGTGSIWQVDKRFIMNFSEIRNGVQAVFFAESDDLVHWNRLGDEYRCDPDPRWYDNTPTGRWDCITALPKPEGGFWGILTARPWPKTRGMSYESIGRVESEDGLHWHSVAPMEVDWGDWPKMNVNEPVGLEEIGSRYYILMGYGTSAEFLGDRHLWNSLGSRAGMYTFIASDPEGPCKPDFEAFPLLVSNSWHVPIYRRPMTAWCARFYRVNDELLVHHHSISRSGLVWFAPLKRALIDEKGHLSLGYWQGNDSIKGKPIEIDLGACKPVYPVWDNPDGRHFPWDFSSSPKITPNHLEINEPHSGGVVFLSNHFDTEKGIILEGTFIIHNPEKGWSSIGVYVEEEINMSGLTQGTAALMQTRGQTELGVFRNSRFNRFRPDDMIEIGITPAKKSHFLMLLRRSLMELYLNGQLIQCYSIADTTTGRLGLVWESGRAIFENIKAWEMNL